MPKIEILDGSDAGSVFEITHKVSYIGRQKDNEIALSDSQSSRKHAQITQSGSKFILKDLGSRNGTLMNGKMVHELELKTGDTFAIGGTVLRFVHIPEVDDQGHEIEPILATRKDNDIDLTKINIKGFEILEMIGKGGMGFVCKARQLSMDRIVAIKILHDKFAHNPEFVSRFISEARAAGKLNHPNLISVHDVGQYNSIYYFSMEYLDGDSVKDLLKEKKVLSIAEATRIVLETAKALDYAHKLNIVHRDIKPDNIMVTPDGKVKLADLGISKVFEEGGAVVNEVMGSPHYMAPEQALGKTVDGRADIYALGCSYYQMVVGDTPYSGVSVQEILRKHVSAPPPNAKGINPSIPGRVNNVIRKMMAKNPEDRYANAAELVVELDKVYDQMAPKRGNKASVELRKLAAEAVSHRKKSRFLMLGIAVGALLVITAVYFIFLRNNSADPGATPTPSASASSFHPGMATPVELQQMYNEFISAKADGKLDKAHEIGTEFILRWGSEYPDYARQIEAERIEIDKKRMGIRIAELSSDFNVLLRDLVTLPPGKRLEAMRVFRQSHQRVFDDYGTEKECSRIGQDLTRREAEAKQEIEKALDNDLAQLKSEVDEHLKRFEYALAESKIGQFRLTHPGKLEQQVSDIQAKVIKTEGDHFYDVALQASTEAKNGRLSLAISILKSFIREQEGRKTVTEARARLEEYTKQLDALWAEKTSLAEAYERTFDFESARREYFALRKQVDFDTDRLREADALVQVVESERDLFNRLIAEIRKQAPISLSFDLTGTLKPDPSQWSIVSADADWFTLKHKTGVEQKFKWETIDGPKIEPLFVKILDKPTSKKDIRALARMLRVHGEDARADALDAAAKAIN